jgi:hypothetical protein
MVRKKSTIVGAVADSVTEAVSTAIDALAHPADTVQQVVAVAKRKVASKRRPTRAVAQVKAAVRKITAKAKRRLATRKKTKRKAVKKAAKRARRR